MNVMNVSWLSSHPDRNTPAVRTYVVWILMSSRKLDEVISQKSNRGWYMVVHILESKQQLNPSHSVPQSQESSNGCCLVNQWNQSQLGGDFSQFPIEPGGLVRAFMFPAGLIQCAPTLKMLKVKPATCINLWWKPYGYESKPWHPTNAPGWYPKTVLLMFVDVYSPVQSIPQRW